MGLDASVRCNCWERGLTQPTPLAPRIAIDEEGYPALKDDDDADFGVFWEWLQTCCVHPDMKQAHEHLANWHGYREFVQALIQAGAAKRFPILFDNLPEANGGLAPAAVAPRMLAELSDFEQSGRFGQRFVLLDSTSGDELRSASESHQFVLTSELRLGVDAEGFFVVTENDDVLFRSKRFTQALLAPEGSDPVRSGPALLTDLDSGTSFRCARAMPGPAIAWPDGRMQNDAGQFRSSYPTAVYFERRDHTSADFNYIVEPLRVLCKAAIETGNPIRWS
ncbi:hypothetical protein [Variovorax boronicumulans]